MVGVLKRLFLGRGLAAEAEADKALAEARLRRDAEVQARQAAEEWRRRRMVSLVDSVEAEATEVASVAPPPEDHHQGDAGVDGR